MIFFAQPLKLNTNIAQRSLKKTPQKKQRIAAGRPTKSIDAQIFNEKTLLKNRAIKEVMLGLEDLYMFALEYPIAATLSLIPW